MSGQDLPTPDHARNMRLIRHSDQGAAHGVQLVVHRGHAYVRHYFYIIEFDGKGSGA